MSWVTKHLEKAAAAAANGQSTKTVAYTAPTSPTPQSVWNNLSKAVEANVLEFNLARGPQYLIMSNDRLLQVIPKQPPVDLAVFQFDERHTVEVVCPISHEGVPRRGQFRIEGESFHSLGDFVGQQSPTAPLTPEQLSEFILTPLLFPCA